MKVSHTRITIEHYRERIVRKDDDRCPQCGYPGEAREAHSSSANQQTRRGTGDDRKVETSGRFQQDNQE